MLILEKYKSSKRKLLLLDYDGTLVGFTVNPEEAKPPVRVLNLLYRLCRDPSVKVVVTTGREYRSIDRLIGHLPIDIIAEHGAMIKENGMWNDLVKMNILWKHEFIPELQRMTSECHGSSIEEKRFSIAWHYRDVDVLGGYIFSRELMRIFENKVSLFNLRILDGNRTLEIITNDVNKGMMIHHLIDKHKCDYVLSIGDGGTDEDMFEVLREGENYITIKVGYGRTAAKYRLDSPQDVVALLEKL